MKTILPVVFFTPALMAGCSDAPPPPLPLTLDYHALGKINLAVQNVVLVDRSMPQTIQPSPARNFHPTIADAVRRWIDDRLVATGASGQAVVIVKDTRLATQALPTANGFDSWFKRQQAGQYTGHVTVEIEAHGPAGYAIASATAMQTVTLPQDPSEAEQQKAYNEMLDGLMKDLNRNLEQNIREHMQNFIVTAPLLPDAPVSPPALPVGPPAATAPLPLTPSVETLPQP